VFTVNMVVVIVDTFMNAAVEPDIVAVTFGALANAVENVTAKVPELVVPDPYKYLVIPFAVDPVGPMGPIGPT
jgi:hypothetical protein